ncbi:MAG TPA: DUF4440 domain-containing protein [Candidatus Sulfotelmatobacter sp.]|nr:DUF4440 domain-containing protein [Candidatus Sulfotelmatobacter sp.]
MKWIFYLAAVCLVSVAQAQTSQDVKNKEMPAFLRQQADTRKTIAESYVRWTEAVKAKNVDALVSMYTDDATVLAEEMESASGKAALRMFYTDWLAKGDTLVDQKFENINSVQEGDLLIDSTKFSGTVVRDGKEISFSGKRLVVWKREFQGPWRMLRDIWNKSPHP